MKFLTYLISVFLLFSCVKDTTDTLNRPVNNLNSINNLSGFESVNVNVKEGYVTELYANESLVAYATKAMAVQIPRGADIKEIYVPIDQYPNTVENSSKNYQVICFEDSEDGDYDYNDLVIHVKYQTKGTYFAFGIHPIALGSSKNIQLGYVLYDGDQLIEKKLLSAAPVRNYLFKSQEGFINTYTKNFYVPYYIKSTIKCWNLSSDKVKRVEWFIIAGGKEFYALSTKYLNRSFDKNGLPYALVISNTGKSYIDKNTVCGLDWFDYPKEAMHLNKCYPDVWKWLTTETKFDPFIYNTNYNPSNTVPAGDLKIYLVNDVDFTKAEYGQNF